MVDVPSREEFEALEKKVAEIEALIDVGLKAIKAAYEVLYPQS